MTKITHKGLWFEYSSLNKEDKKFFKIFITALFVDFIRAFYKKIILIMWSEIFHPSLFYIYACANINSCFIL